MAKYRIKRKVKMVLWGIGGCCLLASTLLFMPKAKPKFIVQPMVKPTFTLPIQHTSTSLFLTGDALIHGSIYYDARQGNRYDFTRMLATVGKIAEPFDLQYYNQETIIGGDDRPFSSYPRFNTPSQFGDAMHSYGFNLVSLANNHCLDQDASGIQNTLAYWNQFEDVHHAGVNASMQEYEEIPVYESKGITYTFFSYTYGTNGLQPPSDMPYLVNYYSDHQDELLAKIKQAKQMVDVVIVAMHWGTEYSHQVNQEQKDLADQMAKAGADIIIGNHPHVIQPIQWLNDHQTICFYAMGNMISAQVGDERLIGAMASLQIDKWQVGHEKKIKIHQVQTDLLYTTYTKVTDNYFKDFDLHLLRDVRPDLFPQYQAILQSLDPSIKVEGIK